MVLHDPDGELPHRAAVFAHGDNGWTVRNDCTRYLVLHNGDDAHRALAPRERITLTGRGFVLSVPGTATAAEVEVRLTPGTTEATAALPWLELAETPLADFPDPTDERRRTGRAFFAAATVGLVLAAGAGVMVWGRSEPAADSAPPPHPAAWDPRLTQLVAFVENDRGLAFKQPVFVDFLPSSAYEDEASLGDIELSPEERGGIDQIVGQMRAVGLIEGGTDLFERFLQLEREGSLAFYDSVKERITVRGTELTEDVRATLVHELTHVLQDQHFDLGRLGGENDTLLRTVVEGDASRVEMSWLRGLSPEALAAYEVAYAAAGKDIDLEGIPEILLVEQGAPYQLGQQLVEALAALGGNPAVDRALQNPPVSDEHLLDPFRYVDRDMPLTVAPPKLGQGEQPFEGFSESGEFGSISLFLMLAQRLDVRQALRAADGWGGDAGVDFLRDGRACTRVSFQGDTAADTDEIAQALAAWAQSMPPDAATSTSAGGLAGFEACDPGPKATIGEPRFQEAIDHASSRTLMAASFLREGIVAQEARCLGGGLLEVFDPELLLSGGQPGAAQQQKMAEITASCVR